MLPSLPVVDFPLWFGLRSRNRNRDRGFTLTEALVAVVVVGVGGALLLPALLVTTTSRQQQIRIERANLLAQQQLDRWRVLLGRGTYDNDDLPNEAAVADLNDLEPPTCDFASATPTCTSPGGDVTIYNFGNDRYVIQNARNNSVSFQDQVISFNAIVRVYSDRVFIGIAPAGPQVPVPALVSGAENIGPLVVLNSQISRGDLPNTLCQINICDAQPTPSPSPTP